MLGQRKLYNVEPTWALLRWPMLDLETIQLVLVYISFEHSPDSLRHSESVSVGTVGVPHGGVAPVAERKTSHFRKYVTKP